MVTRAHDAGGVGGDYTTYSTTVYVLCVYNIIYDVFLQVRVGLFDLDSF